MYEFKEQDAYDFARHVGIRTRVRGTELHFHICPYCRSQKDKETFAIDLRTGQFKCLRASCSHQGNMLTLAGDFDLSLGNEVDEYYAPRQTYRRLKTPEKPIIPEEPAVKYLGGRGISAETVKRYEITTHNTYDNVIVFPFYDENGKLEFVKYRKTDFDPARDKNKEWCEQGCRPILFGMKQCNDKFERLVVTEGQIDSLSIAEAGIENAVSVPTGKNGFTWVPYCWNWIRKFQEIVVFGDLEKGCMTLLDDFRKRFQNKVKYVPQENYMGSKDANELLQKHGAQAVKEAVENAVYVPVQKVISLAEVENVNIYQLEKMQTGIQELDRLLYGGLHFGQVVIIAGKRGDGKSTFASELFANALDQDYKCLAYSGELPNHMFKAWLDFQIAGQSHILEEKRGNGSLNRYISQNNHSRISSWYKDKAFIYDSRIIEGEEQENLLKTIAEAVMQYGIRVVLIDNLMTALDMDLSNGDRYERQGVFVKKLEKMALRLDILIILVAHRRKNRFSEDANDEVAGSADITNAAGVVVSYDRDKILDMSQRRLVVSKNRLTGKLNFDGIILNYDEKSKRIYGSGDDVNRQYGWDKSDGFVPAVEWEIPFS